MTTEEGSSGTRPLPHNHAGMRPPIRGANDLTELPREDLAAGLQARRELGPEYDAAFAESLLERVDQTIVARLHGSSQPPRSDLEQAYLLRLQQENAKGERKVSVAIVCFSLGVSVPLSGIAAGMHSLAFLMIIWTGIVMINMAHALRRRG